MPRRQPPSPDLRLARLISGGQTGADQGALAAARELGLPTGGFMPQGFATEDGPRPDFALLYGMREHREPGAAPRTQANVCQSDATLIIGDIAGGSRATHEFCASHAKPCFVVAWRPGDRVPLHAMADFRAWLAGHQIRVLNVAGDRESQAPGIYEAVRAFLLACFGG
ncbi:MAG TPA: putative molybdenum carrier protein [Methylovirgula sp.]|nr:putative molybdenum carrier protein [Methylovirgula sp.]